MTLTMFSLALTVCPGFVFGQSTTPPATSSTSHAKSTMNHTVARKLAALCSTCVAPKLPASIPAVTGDFQSVYVLLHSAYPMTRVTESVVMVEETRKVLLNYIDINVGAGEVAPPTGFFTVHYTGYLSSDGKKFDSSFDRGEPITFPVGDHRVIPGWDSGFAGMRIGGKRRLFIPYELGYGDRGRLPVIPPKAELIFDVELISVSNNAPEPKAIPLEKRLSDDAVAKYRITERQGTAMDRCEQAALVSLAYLDAKDESNYATWKSTEHSDCAAAGVSPP